ARYIEGSIKEDNLVDETVSFSMEYISEAFLGEDSEYSDMSMGENSNNAAGFLPNPAADPQDGMPNSVESSSSEPSKVLRYFPIGPTLKRLNVIPWVAHEMAWDHPSPQ
ncbi:hypothetical protein MKW98_006024, partial [Papaver atlanticum]